MTLFEALAQLLDLAIDELPEIEPGRQFILEPIPDKGVAICIGDFLVKIVEDRGKPILPFGGVSYTKGHPFHDCTCQECQQLHAITEKYSATMQKAS